MPTSDIDTAEHLTRRRARIALILGVLFITTQISASPDLPLERNVDIVQFGAWVIWVAAFVLFLVFGGGVFRRARIRSLMNDEGSEKNRHDSLIHGYWAAIITSMICYAATFYETLDARSILHIIITVGVGTAMISFGALERRAFAE